MAQVRANEAHMFWKRHLGLMLPPTRNCRLGVRTAHTGIRRPPRRFVWNATFSSVASAVGSEVNHSWVKAGRRSPKGLGLDPAVSRVTFAKGVVSRHFLAGNPEGRGRLAPFPLAGTAGNGWPPRRQNWLLRFARNGIEAQALDALGTVPKGRLAGGIAQPSLYLGLSNAKRVNYASSADWVACVIASNRKSSIKMLNSNARHIGPAYRKMRAMVRRVIPLRQRQQLLRVLDPRHQRGQLFDPEQIPRLVDTYFRYGSSIGTPWDEFRDAHLRLPNWFRYDLDPLSSTFREQQLRLWQLIAGVDRPYDPTIHEKEHELDRVDAIRRPGYYIRRDDDAISSASDHIIAIGMLLKHCGLRAGDWALEYGPGFGQGALTLARLGVNVDTVDVSESFCSRVQQQAEFFDVPLTAFNGQFGMSPRPGRKYKVIWFYESFHHCLAFQQLLPVLRDLLAEGGRVILSGEPVMETENTAVPYPWGVRLHSEVIAIVRRLHWMELGFSEHFLYRIFADAGFAGTRIDCDPTLFGRQYHFIVK